MHASITLLENYNTVSLVQQSARIESRSVRGMLPALYLGIVDMAKFDNY